MVGSVLRTPATLGPTLAPRQRIGTQLIRAFEARAAEHGCSSFYLETYNFQAPRLYQSLGYTVAYEHNVYPHGIVKYIMVKHVPGSQNAA